MCDGCDYLSNVPDGEIALQITWRRTIDQKAPNVNATSVTVDVNDEAGQPTPLLVLGMLSALAQEVRIMALAEVARATGRPEVADLILGMASDPYQLSSVNGLDLDGLLKQCVGHADTTDEG